MSTTSGAVVFCEQEQVTLVESPESVKNDERRTHPRLPVSTPAELSIEEGTEGEAGGEGRSYQRVDVAYAIKVEAALTLRGHQVMQLTLMGTSIDISRGGMLIRVEQDVALGARCEVFFSDAMGKIVPDRVGGKVRRSRGHRGAFHLAIEFDTPLEVLEVADGSS